MSIVLTGTKTVTTAVSPSLTAASLTTLLATPIESATVGQLRKLLDACSRVAGGGAENATIGSILT